LRGPAVRHAAGAITGLSRRLDDATTVRSVTGWRVTHGAGAVPERVRSGDAATEDDLFGRHGHPEKVVATLKDALMKSQKPEAKQQLAGWKIIKNSMPQPDQSIVYVHIINVVKDADYSITNLVYEVVTDPMERTNFYNLYKGALKGALFAIQGPMIADFSK
jgi:hypothetical protein